ncbi:MAG TPA: diguanylate cyclase [Spirochaetota bacterium]|nr:diguanylate cyclase [Spirochaetota bacterium]HQF10519.1 diguanylate cyclase [Spirochaetota bacterium]HQH99526.1 diguanylate cyclase [Spirochaetota bacterium]HQJ73187.1 diguanylate cyclase [Spirochaetota bacterium]
MNQIIDSTVLNNQKIHFTVIGFVLVLLFGFIDSLIDYRVSFSIFYVLPVVLVTWYTGIRIGILFSILSSAMWFAASLISHNQQAPLPIIAWNTVVRLGFFIIISSVLHYFKSERENARMDYLTRIANRRHFEEMLSNEIQRSNRYNHPLSIIYMDVDNFKTINDNLGHRAGDKVLTAISTIINSHIRSSDAIARLGGDEFAILLVETDEQEAGKFIKKVQYELLLAMESYTFPVTFSFGIATFYSFTKNIREMMHIADSCMYHSKKSGKNRISLQVVR